MISLILRGINEALLEEIGEGMKDGKTCIYPTETCYGLGTNALDKGAVRKIYEIKERPEEKKLSCIVGSMEQAESHCSLSKMERELCDKFMPGPLTLVAGKKGSIPDLLNDKFVFRISSNEIARKLADMTGVPIVSTSANLSGAPNPYSLEDISRLVKDKVDYILDSGELEPEDPSTVVELKGDEVKIYREGPVSKEEIVKFLTVVEV